MLDPSPELMALEIKDCTQCPNIRNEFDSTGDCYVFSCARAQRTIIDEFDYEIFKKNGHEKIPIPRFCPLK